MRGRGAAGIIAVFGLLKRGGKVHTAIIPNANTTYVDAKYRRACMPDSIVYTDTFQMLINYMPR